MHGRPPDYAAGERFRYLLLFACHPRLTPPAAGPHPLLRELVALLAVFLLVRCPRGDFSVCEIGREFRAVF